MLDVGCSMFAYPAQRVLIDLELRGARIGQQAMLNPRQAQVAKDSGRMFVRQSLRVDSFLFVPFAPFRGRFGWWPKPAWNGSALKRTTTVRRAPVGRRHRQSPGDIDRARTSDTTPPETSGKAEA
jgi:hypothetical protein